jgi:hypothetical protein
MTHPEWPPPQAVSTKKDSKEASRQVGAFIPYLTDKLRGGPGPSSAQEITRFVNTLAHKIAQQNSTDITPPIGSRVGIGDH